MEGESLANRAVALETVVAHDPDYGCRTGRVLPVPSHVGLYNGLHSRQHHHNASGN